MVGHAFITGLDNAVLSLVAEARYWLLTDFFVELTDIGSFTFAMVLVIGLWVMDQKEVSVLTLTGSVSAGGTALLIKQIIGRARPDMAQDVLSYSLASYAFPSGHSALAFAVAVILADRYRQARTFLYTLAALIAVSRVYLGVHYVTDILAGAVLGLIVGKLVLRYDDNILSATPLKNAR